MPGFLLDTNIISELVKPSPEERVLRWVADQSALDLHLSAVTLGELTRGAVRLPAGKRRERLRRWIDEELQRQFEGRILALDRHAGAIWGTIMGDGDRTGRQRAAIDAQIAATAIHHDMSLVTRNEADFQGVSITLINPWKIA